MKVVLQRLIQLFLSLWILATATFFLMKVFPGSPFDEGTSLHPSVLEQLQSHYGLDRSWPEQYWSFLSQLAHGKFGLSQFYLGRDASEIILRYFPVTASLAFYALVLSVFSSLGLALLAFLSRGGHLLYQLLTLAALSVPLLLAGPLVIYIFGFKLNLLPVALLESPWSYVLPVTIMALKPTASLTRLLYASLEENRNSDFLRTARAFGFSDLQVLLRKNLRISLVSFVAHLGPLAALLLAGSTMVEIIFALPGLGSQFVEAVLSRDTSMVIGLTLFYGFFVLIFQMLVDLALTWLDPRVKHS